MKAIVPIKGFTQAKQRLAPLLSGAERRALMTHMIDDVLSVVCQTEGISGLVVITNDEDVRAQARLYNARIMAEPDAEDPNIEDPDVEGLDAGNINNPTSPDRASGAETDGIQTVGVERLNQVFAMAMKRLADEGEDGVLLLPADVPLITIGNLKQMLALHSQPGVTIVPARADGGTNAMMVSPPQLIAPGYGHRSCQRHSDFARAVGIEPVLLDTSATGADNGAIELGLDVDTVDDLRKLMAAPINSQTQRFLLDSDIMKRIECFEQQSFDSKTFDTENVLRDGRKTA